MDYAQTEEHKMLRESVRDFLAKELAPIADEIDRESRFPMEVFKKMGRLGFLGLVLPEEYGGGGDDYIGCAIVQEEIAKVCASTFTSTMGHIFCGHWIDIFGTEEQEKKYLPDLATTEKIGAIGMTEPEAGSDLASLRTTALRDGEYYVLNGSKMFITNAPVADVMVVLASTDKSKGPKGISTFIVDTNTPGFSTGKPLDKLGNRASPLSEVFFEDCRVPAPNLLGKEGEGFFGALKFLSFERMMVMVCCAALAEAALEASIKYAKERVQFGRPIAKFQSIQNMIADMSTGIFASQCMAYRVMTSLQEGRDCAVEAAKGKLFATEMVMKATIDAIQIFGGYGYTKDFPVERYMRDAKAFSIGGGTSEIQRLIIAGDLLKG